ncbi:FAD-binding oxidoreductase [Paraburkholderia rhizosphaerae]|uniref:FAD/FMN-containing dehydrogenase n=1 Tax=Paraburkholderia rhizosphaerae TaxID=480658 RepID=A0A4R8LJ89_9BURK|nr:FAD-binding oxidoreductase [Paraburkholderia rhizosphaerae]TDY43842.1 FAD/FMN-containing dehydrogenase [Paraburkholderia rhizosphaerae]
MASLTRRALINATLGLAATGYVGRFGSLAAGQESTLPASRTTQRVRVADSDWPSRTEWAALNQRVGGRLLDVTSPLDVCRHAPRDAACRNIIKQLNNPYFLGDEPALTQTSGWIDAWSSTPGPYAVAAEQSNDVAEAVRFARDHRLRLVIKGGGHSYQGTSNAADSLLIWTRRMRGIRLYDAFVPLDCVGDMPPQPAVTVAAGEIWMHVYDAVTTQGGRYVQGGGCATVGVAGLVQSGGFGSFSKKFGTAAGSLLEAQVVSADGVERIVNARTDPDLFWALKGGGGGSFGVVTSVTLKTHPLPDYVGVVSAAINASSPAAFRRLIDRFLSFYAANLLNEHWGETVSMRPNSTLRISMLFQGLDREEATRVWKPFLDSLANSKADFTVIEPIQVIAIPARHLWDPAFVMKNAPGVMIGDSRRGAAPGDVFWASNQREAGQFLHGYESMWLPASLLDGSARASLSDALFEASQQWNVSLHFNKGLAGAPEEARQAARDTAMNPDVLNAFALAIIAGEGPPAFAGMPGTTIDEMAAREAAIRIREAARSLRVVAPQAGAYVSESSFFQQDWPRAYWGEHYSRLREVKRKYDPDGLFFVHQGVGSEEWDREGFTRLSPGGV